MIQFKKMSSSNKVGELFKAAGKALGQLGELTLQLQPSTEQAVSSGKWTDAEVDLLMSSVKRFSEDLNKISETIKARTIAQIRTQMKRKAFEEAGLPLSVSSAVKVVSSSEVKRNLLESQLPVVSESLHVKTEKSTVIEQENLTPTMMSVNAAQGFCPTEVTLSALNATEADVDIEALTEHHLSSKKMKVDLGNIRSVSSSGGGIP